MKKITLSLSLFLFILKAFSQDNDAMARTYYVNAEEYFNKGTLSAYDSCITELEKAENALRSTNPKILYLKIRAMSQFLSPHLDRYYIYDLNKSLQKFFEITDSRNYPEDKYSEIININAGLRDKCKNPHILQDSSYRSSDSALYQRSYCYRSMDNDQFAEFYLIRSATENSYAKAMSALGSLYCERIQKLYHNSTGYNKQVYDMQVKAIADAERWCNKAAANGDYHLWGEFGSALYVYVQDYHKAFQYLTLASDKNDGDASYWLGDLYRTGVNQGGLNIKRDYKKAMDYFLKASDSKCLHMASARREISYMYANGDGVKKDKALAKEWEQKAASGQ